MCDDDQLNPHLVIRWDVLITLQMFKTQLYICLSFNHLIRVVELFRQVALCFMGTPAGLDLGVRDPNKAEV